jgi:hypothetical protein
MFVQRSAVSLLPMLSLAHSLSLSLSTKSLTPSPNSQLAPCRRTAVGTKKCVKSTNPMHTARPSYQSVHVPSRRVGTVFEAIPSPRTQKRPKTAHRDVGGCRTHPRPCTSGGALHTGHVRAGPQRLVQFPQDQLPKCKYDPQYSDASKAPMCNAFADSGVVS